MTTEKRNGVAAVERALSLLDAFTERDRALSLAELARRTNLDKATTLRLARSLAHRGMLMRNADASWRLGPKLARLGMLYQATFRAQDVVEPALARLSRRTGESAAVYVREGSSRVCLFRHDSEQSVRHHVRVGDMLPLDIGAPGRVILAFSGERGDVYDLIRSRRFHMTVGERDPQVASVVVPIFETEDRLFGALAVTGPPSRFDVPAIDRHLRELRLTGAELTAALGGDPALFEARDAMPADERDR